MTYIKPIADLTRLEYESLKNGGMLWELYPEALGDHKLDACIAKWEDFLGDSLTEEILEETILKMEVQGETTGTTLFNYDSPECSTVWQFLDAMFQAYEAMGFKNGLEVNVEGILYGEPIKFKPKG